MVIKEVIIKVPNEISSCKVKLLVAAQLYKDGEITLKQAAEMAEATTWDILHEFGRLKISFTNISVEELREELEEVL